MDRIEDQNGAVDLNAHLLVIKEGPHGDSLVWSWTVLNVINSRRVSRQSHVASRLALSWSSCWFRVARTWPISVQDYYHRDNSS